MRRVVVLGAVLGAVIALGVSGGAGAATLRPPAWAKPLLSQLSQWLGPPHARAFSVTPAVVPPTPPAPTLHGFTCYIDTIGSAIAGAAGGGGCGAAAYALPVLAP